MTRLLLLLALLAPALPAAAQEDIDSALEEVLEDEATEESEEAAPDRDAALRALVVDYYTRLGTEPTDAELRDGLGSVRLMLEDGVSMARIREAIDTAVELHSPGRRIPFQVAVPLRVRPADPGDVVAEEPAPETLSIEREDLETDDEEAADDEVATTDDASAGNSVIEERWVKRQEELRQRRNRYRLYQQWRDRTRDKRALIGIGVPLLAGGWAGTWALAGTALSFGEVLPSVGWTAAIPVAGPFVFGGLTGGGAYPGVFVLGALQGIGLGLTIVGLAQKHDLPYDRDPTALRIGRDRHGRPRLLLKPQPTGLGAGLSGRF